MNGTERNLEILRAHFLTGLSYPRISQKVFLGQNAILEEKHELVLVSVSYETNLHSHAGLWPRERHLHWEIGRNLV